MNNALTIEKAIRDGAGSDSESRIMVSGRCVGYLTGVVNNVGSLLNPRYVVTRYIVEVDVGEVERKAEFAKRGESIKWVKGLFA